MEISVLGQGYDSESKNSVGNKIIECLGSKDYNKFIGITAFSSKSGVSGLARYFDEAKSNYDSFTIITGIDQKGTSKGALKALLSLDIETYIFYQTAFSIFHPKIYLFEGPKFSKLIIGSSNLTAQGLFVNVEASLLISIDNEDPKDLKVVQDLKEYYQGLFDLTDPNLAKLTPVLIDNLVEAEIVPKESERKNVHEKKRTKIKKKVYDLLRSIFPKRNLSKIPKEFRSKTNSNKSKKAKVQVGNNLDTKKGADFEMLNDFIWESGPLTERDLNIPKAKGTNPTGSMNFKKGNTPGIDQRHFFREVLFSELNWQYDARKGSEHFERVYANFQFIISGENMGVFKLLISHNTKQDTTSYIQKNSMTSLSWGDAKSLVANKKLLGKNAKLAIYNDNDEIDFQFVIE